MLRGVSADRRSSAARSGAKWQPASASGTTSAPDTMALMTSWVSPPQPRARWGPSRTDRMVAPAAGQSRSLRRSSCARDRSGRTLTPPSCHGRTERCWVRSFARALLLIKRTWGVLGSRQGSSCPSRC